jgi:hypothetical protein
LHYFGVNYQWGEGKGLDDLPLAELPEIILIAKPEDKAPLKERYNGADKGTRNDTLARLTGSWVNDNLSFGECMENARIWNSRNNPPLPEKEMERTVKSIFEKHQREQTDQLRRCRDPHCPHS